MSSGPGSIRFTRDEFLSGKISREDFIEIQKKCIANNNEAYISIINGINKENLLFLLDEKNSLEDLWNRNILIDISPRFVKPKIPRIEA